MANRFNNSNECAHVWAQQVQDRGHAGSTSFIGTEFYSYNTVIAKFITPDVVVVSAYSHSHTTDRHRRIVFNAVTHKTVLEIPGHIYPHQDLSAQDCVDAIADYIDTTTALHKTSIKLYRSQMVWVNRIKDWANAFPEVVIPTYTLCLTEDEVTKAEKLSEARNAARVNTDAEFVAAVKAEFDKRLEQLDGEVKTLEQCWREGVEYENARLPYGTTITFYSADGKRRTRKISKKYAWELGIANMVGGGSTSTHALVLGHGAPVMLRVNDSTVETSKGASVPLKAAEILYKAVKSGRDVKGYKIGYYTVTDVQPDEIIIGCHTIPMEEVELLATSQSWNKD